MHMTSTPTRSIFSHKVHTVENNFSADNQNTNSISISSDKSHWIVSSGNQIGIAVEQTLFPEICEDVDSVNFAEFVSKSLRPLSFSRYDSFQSILRYQQMFLPFLDPWRNVVFLWCEEDYNALLREGLLREARPMQDILYQQLLASDVNRPREQHNYLDRNVASFQPTIKSSQSQPLSIHKSEKNTTARRSSEPQTKCEAPVQIPTRRHSISSIPSKDYKSTSSPTDTNQSASSIEEHSLVHETTPSFSFTENVQNNGAQQKKRAEEQEPSNEVEDGRILVFDGVVRRKNRSNQPQDSYQIKFKLI